MRHRMKGKKLGRDTPHRRALRRNLATSLIEEGSIVTSLAKAKYVRPYVEKLVTHAKRGNRNDYAKVKYLKSRLTTDESVAKLLREIAPKYTDRSGGYTRITRIGERKGDNSPLVRISFVEGK